MDDNKSTTVKKTVKSGITFERFYEKFGFQKLSNVKYGCGMVIEM